MPKDMQRRMFAAEVADIRFFLIPGPRRTHSVSQIPVQMEQFMVKGNTTHIHIVYIAHARGGFNA